MFDIMMRLLMIGHVDSCLATAGWWLDTRGLDHLWLQTPETPIILISWGQKSRTQPEVVERAIEASLIRIWRSIEAKLYWSGWLERSRGVSWRTEIEIHNRGGERQRKVSGGEEELLVLGDQELDAPGLDPDVSEVLLTHEAVLRLLWPQEVGGPDQGQVTRGHPCHWCWLGEQVQVTHQVSQGTEMGLMALCLKREF